MMLHVWSRADVCPVCPTHVTEMLQYSIRLKRYVGPVKWTYKCNNRDGVYSDTRTSKGESKMADLHSKPAELHYTCIIVQQHLKNLIPTAYTIEVNHVLECYKTYILCPVICYNHVLYYVCTYIRSRDWSSITFVLHLLQDFVIHQSRLCCDTWWVCKVRCLHRKPNMSITRKWLPTLVYWLQLPKGWPARP